jgi:hypothetical protein
VSCFSLRICSASVSESLSILTRGRSTQRRLAGLADYSQKKLAALLDSAGVDRSGIVLKKGLYEKV